MSKRHHSSSKGGLLHFVFMPIIFSALIVLTCYVVVRPQLGGYIDLASMFFSDDKKDFSESSRNIFVPLPEESSQETSDPVVKPPEQPKVVSIKDIEYPEYGDEYGELIIEDCQIDNRVFYGDSRAQLAYGCGTYIGSFLPGFGGTTLIAGHNNTYFNSLKYAEVGQKVKFRTSYGNYVYEITDIQVKDHADKTAVDLETTTENLVMYTCYPFDTLGLTSLRCFIYCKYVSGPVVDLHAN